MEIFAKRLKERREQLDMTQKDLAAKAEIATTSLSAYENGRKLPAVDAAAKLAEAMEVSLDWLCGKGEQSKRGEPETMADVVRFFSGLGDRLGYMSLGREQIPLHLEPIVPDDEQVYFLEPDLEPGSNQESHDLNRDCAVFRTRYYPIAHFFDDWSQMHKLYCDGTIKPGLYRTWIGDQIEKNRDVKLPGSRE